MCEDLPVPMKASLRRLVIPASLAALLAGGAAGGMLLAAGAPPKPSHPQAASRTTTTTSHPSTTTTTDPPPAWRVAWGSGMAWGNGVASNVTVRELATVGVGGGAVRVRISNLFGNAPMVIGAATVGLSAGGSSIVAGTLAPLAFGGAPTTTVAPGQFVYSDPVTMTVQDLQTLAVSVYVSDSDLVTLHPCCALQGDVSFFTPNGGGNLTSSLTGAGLSVASKYPRWVDAVDVLQTAGQGSIVVVGDSITDGYNTTLRWTDVLQRRIDTLPPSEQRGVVNEGITANALTSLPDDDSAKGGGPSGISRLARDALDQPGVSELVLFLGTNDLWFGQSAQVLIQGYQQAIALAHQAGVRIIGVTLLPRMSGGPASEFEYWSPADQAAMQQVNSWILTSGAFDGVINLAATIGDVYDGACSPTTMFLPYDSGDNLHPNAAGQTAMGNAVDPTVLGLPPIPQVPPLVNVTPTPGCNATG
jgi:lysophospholipase L1-like esterase